MDDQQPMTEGVFISEPIHVDYDTEKRAPTAFVWRGTRREIVETLREWQDWQVPNYEHARGWIHRRHRNYYHVRTADGHVYEIYLDRAAHRRNWVLLKQIA